FALVVAQLVLYPLQAEVARVVAQARNQVRLSGAFCVCLDRLPARLRDMKLPGVLACGRIDSWDKARHPHLLELAYNAFSGAFIEQGPRKWIVLENALNLS